VCPRGGRELGSRGFPPGLTRWGPQHRDRDRDEHPVAGVGLHADRNDQAERAAHSIKQALLYWEAHDARGTLGDDSITVNGASISGNRIGGPTLFFGSTSFASYRADITSQLGIGGNRFDIVVPPGNANRDLFAYDGAGILAIVERKQGGGSATIGVRDGQDMAFFQPLPRSTRPCSRAYFTAVASERTATVVMFVGSVSSRTCNPARGTIRPNVIETTSGGTTTAWLDFLGSDVGCEFDTLSFPVTVPIGATSLSLRLLSACDNAATCPSPNLPASMAWITGSATIPGEEVKNRMTGGGSSDRWGSRDARLRAALRCDEAAELLGSTGTGTASTEPLTSADCSNDQSTRSANFDVPGIGRGYNARRALPPVDSDAR
jgi:hypothetical protein